MKNIDECKKVIATDFAYPSWLALVSHFEKLPPHAIDYVIDKLLNMYADEVEKEISKCIHPNAMKH